MLRRMVLLTCALAVTGCKPAGPPPDPARVLADRVAAAGGAAQWSRVKRLGFTYTLSQGDKQIIQAKHDWDLKTGIDTITWAGKTVRVNVKSPGDTDDQREAYARWGNDTHWLLGAIRLADPSAELAHKGDQDMVGRTYPTLALYIENRAAARKEEYDLYIDPKDFLVRYWDHLPTSDPDRKTTASWENYQDFGGLKLSTVRHAGDRTVSFTEIKVEK